MRLTKEEKELRDEKRRLEWERERDMEREQVELEMYADANIIERYFSKKVPNFVNKRIHVLALYGAMYSRCIESGDIRDMIREIKNQPTQGETK